ncbi:NAD(P)-dependent dehydrogenase (short-subunit alcohol dehydrogenase family) [Mycobacterium sp. URHB0021]
MTLHCALSRSFITVNAVHPEYVATSRCKELALALWGGDVRVEALALAPDQCRHRPAAFSSAMICWTGLPRRLAKS